MTKLEKIALDWAESNSSPDANEGRDQMYDFLIAVQQQAYADGVLKGIDMCEDLHDRDDLSGNGFYKLRNSLTSWNN
jgi:hypothetical protein